MGTCSYFAVLRGIIALHDDVIKWKHFPRYWPFVRGIHQWPMNSPHKGQWRGALIFSWICVWINGWENIREAGDTKFRVTGLRASNSPVTGEFHTQRVSNAENVSIWWRHHSQGNFSVIFLLMRMSIRWPTMTRVNFLKLSASSSIHQPCVCNFLS